MIRSRYAATWLGLLSADPALAHGIHPDGHGGLELPTASALIYRPSQRLADLVRSAYRTCTFPGCDVPSSRCQLDHLVPFLRKDRLRGGWTVASNLHPVCIFHHQAKTAKKWSAVMLSHGTVLWTNRNGVNRITLPDFMIGNLTTSRRRRRSEADRAADALDTAAPTWWETNRGNASPPTLAEISAATTDHARAVLQALRRRYREHCGIVHARARAEPPPF